MQTSQTEQHNRIQFMYKFYYVHYRLFDKNSAENWFKSRDVMDTDSLQATAIKFKWHLKRTSWASLKQLRKKNSSIKTKYNSEKNMISINDLPGLEKVFIILNSSTILSKESISLISLAMLQQA